MPPPNDRKCSVENCDRKHRGRGFCQYHYNRLYRGSTLEKATTEERFWKFVSKGDTCWLWTGYISEGGYGIFNAGKIVKAHRFSYVLANGRIPSELVLDHLCRVRHCVNPTHLEPVTFKENIIRGVGNANKTVCKNGHPLTEGHFYKPKRGGRACKLCGIAASAEYKKKKRETAFRKNLE